jgi:hypothetical protein
MNSTKPASKEEPAPVTMDDIARRFLSTAPTPHKPAQPKGKAKKTSKPAK